MDPSHCRLCLQSVPKHELQSHLESVHQISSIQAYRHEVFARTLAEWPQQITPQILRSRLAAFTVEMSDQNFKELPCASCARQKRICKLREVQPQRIPLLGFHGMQNHGRHIVKAGATTSTKYFRQLVICNGFSSPTRD